MIGPPVSNVIKSLTAFKNRKQNTWTDCRRTTYDGYKSSDSYRGYTQKFDSDIINSIFIGDSGKFPIIIYLSFLLTVSASMQR